MAAAPRALGFGHVYETKRGTQIMKLFHFAAGALLLAVAACSQPEPEPVYLQPTYEGKAGEPTCPAGYALSTLDSGALVCAPLPPA